MSEPWSLRAVRRPLQVQSCTHFYSRLCAAGADIEEMSGLGLADCINKGYLKEWQTIFDRLCKPVIAAVNGYAVRFEDGEALTFG